MVLFKSHQIWHNGISGLKNSSSFISLPQNHRESPGILVQWCSMWYISLKQSSLIPCIISSDLSDINILDHTLFCFIIDTFIQMVVLIPTCSSILILVNSWWPSDTIWRQRSGSTLAQVMVCCLKAPSYCLNQCWLVRNVVWPTSNTCIK